MSDKTIEYNTRNKLDGKRGDGWPHITEYRHQHAQQTQQAPTRKNDRPDTPSMNEGSTSPNRINTAPKLKDEQRARLRNFLYTASSFFMALLATTTDIPDKPASSAKAKYERYKKYSPAASRLSNRARQMLVRTPTTPITAL